MDEMELPARCLVCWDALEDAERIPYCDLCWRREHIKLIVDATDTYGLRVGAMTAGYLSGRELGEDEASGVDWRDYLIEEIFTTATDVSASLRYPDGRVEPYELWHPADILRLWNPSWPPTSDAARLTGAVARLRIYHRDRHGFLEGRWSRQLGRGIWLFSDIAPEHHKAWMTLLTGKRGRGRPRKSAGKRSEDGYEMHRRYATAYDYVIAEGGDPTHENMARALLYSDPSSIRRLHRQYGFTSRKGQ